MPPTPPAADGIETDLEFALDLMVSFAFIGRQHNAGSFDDLLFCLMFLHQFIQGCCFGLTQLDFDSL